MTEYKTVIHIAENANVECSLKGKLPLEKYEKFRVEYNRESYDYSHVEEKENEVLYHFKKEVE